MTTVKAAANARPLAASWRGQKIPIAAMLAIFIAAPFVVYPVVLMKALCFALFACAFNLLIGYVGLLSFGGIRGGPYREGVGIAS
jgi:branched-chain amino acid transport system permease protein